eukprot:2009200-Rhodomonas_salina.1
MEPEELLREFLATTRHLQLLAWRKDTTTMRVDEELKVHLRHGAGLTAFWLLHDGEAPKGASFGPGRLDARLEGVFLGWFIFDMELDLRPFGCYMTAKLPKEHPLVQVDSTHAWKESSLGWGLEGVFLGWQDTTPAAWMYSVRLQRTMRVQDA